MNKKKIAAIALSSVLAFSTLAMFAGCGGNGGEALVPRVCYDNLPNDGISIPDSATHLSVKGIASYKEYTPAGRGAAAGTVAKVDGSTVTAVGKGYVILTLDDGKTMRVDVEPAYVTDPDNEYKAGDDAQSSKLLGGTHDPSLIEVEENGQPAYYIFSTGWNYGNEIRKSTDLIHWDYLGKATSTSTKLDKIEAWEQESNSTIQWWAPDIVPAHGGGYWLYTCCVSNSKTHQTSFGTCSLACIVLFHSDTLQPNSFEYQGVLMQSAIPGAGGESTININSIDPQIIYSPDGRMFMAYGSFGTGNWMLELDPTTGLRKDNFYKGGANADFLTPEQVREYRTAVCNANLYYNEFSENGEFVNEYYGHLISLNNMEAPVIARHDNVTMTDENGKQIAGPKTYYYSMHSYNGLAEHYQMWGGRSEDVFGTYRSVCGTAESYGIVSNSTPGASNNFGNKYTGRFTWADKTSNNIDIILPGHNDLFTNSVGTNLAAYITRSPAYGTQSTGSYDGGFVSQVHQYYLNSLGHIVINPNRYGGEVNRAVSEQELFQYTEDRTFKMVVLANDDDPKTSVEVKLEEGGKVTSEGDEIGTWKMYGDGYIYFHFTNTEAVDMLYASEETTFYGVVRPAWLEDQNRSGFTITCMGATKYEDPTDYANNRSMAMFMNNVSTMSGSDADDNLLSKN